MSQLGPDGKVGNLGFMRCPKCKKMVRDEGFMTHRQWCKGIKPPPDWTMRKIEVCICGCARGQHYKYRPDIQSCGNCGVCKNFTLHHKESLHMRASSPTTLHPIFRP